MRYGLPVAARFLEAGASALGYRPPAPEMIAPAEKSPMTPKTA
jgi:hypothetical protein